MKKLAFIPFLFFGLTFNLFAQGELSFNEERYDFGVINEGVQAVHEFEFINTGNAPVVISNVRASCGCTTPFWTKDPVMPGEKGIVKASYNSQGRPGTFNKSITISSNAKEPSKVLYIKGIVNRGGASTEPTEEEKKKSPQLSLDKTNYSFGKVEKGEQVSRKFKIKNTGKTDLSIGKMQAACNCITSNLEKNVLKPGESGEIELLYRPVYGGMNKDIITLFTNSVTDPFVPVVLEAEVVDAVSANSPVKQDSQNPFK